MLEPLLERLAGSLPAEKLSCVSAAEAVRLWFGRDLPRMAGTADKSGASGIELLFCLRGNIWLRWPDGFAVLAAGRSVLLIARGESCTVARWSGQAGFVLLAAESPGALAALAGTGSAMEAEEIERLSASNGGCSRLEGYAWCAGTAAAMEALPPSHRNSFCLSKAVEALQLVGWGAMRLVPAEAVYFDAGQTAAVKAARDYMVEHLEESMTVPELSRRFGLSATTFKSCFRQLYGAPPHRYLQNCRMEKAARLLQEDGLSVLQVSEEVGYASVSQFGAAFKRHYGLPPSAFRFQANKMSETGEGRLIRRES